MRKQTFFALATIVAVASLIGGLTGPAAKNSPREHPSLQRLARHARMAYCWG